VCFGILKFIRITIGEPSVIPALRRMRWEDGQFGLHSKTLSKKLTVFLENKPAIFLTLNYTLESPGVLLEIYL
jgi:hypothetical protein